MITKNIKTPLMLVVLASLMALSLLAQVFPTDNVVTKYGALGNGVHDDTAAINAAIVASDGISPVLFPRGSYVVSGPIICGHNAILLGNNTYTSGILLTTPNAAIFFEDGTSFKMKDLALYGSGGATNGLVIGSLTTSGNGAIVEGCLFSGLGTGINYIKGNTTVFRDCIITRNRVGYKSGSDICFPGQYVNLVTFDHCSLTGNGAGARLFSAFQPQFINGCDFEGNTNGGIIVSPVNGRSVTDLTISDSYFENNAFGSTNTSSQIQFNIGTNNAVRNTSILRTYFLNNANTNVASLYLGPGNYSLVDNDFSVPFGGAIIVSNTPLVIVHGSSTLLDAEGYPDVSPNAYFYCTDPSLGGIVTTCAPLANISWDFYGPTNKRVYTGITKMTYENGGNGQLVVNSRLTVNNAAGAKFKMVVNSTTNGFVFVPQ